MKIIKVINSLDFGGIEKVFEIAAKYYPGDKRDLIFVSLGGGGKAADRIRDLGYRTLILNEKTKIPNVGLILKLYRFFKLEKPDVVHACGAEGNFHGLVAAWLAHVPVRIGEEIGMPSHSALAKRIFRMVYRRSSGVIVVAKTVGDYLIKNKEAKSEDVHLLYNPVDSAHYTPEPHAADANEFVFLAVCRLHPIKNLDRLIRCFARVAKDAPTARLWLVGDGPSRESLEAAVKEANLSPVVTFFGFQPDPKPYYAKASVFVLPSLSEGHPVSMVEAMMMGIPAICTKVGGAPEIIRQDESGWLIDPLNEQQIVDTMQHVMTIGTERLRHVSDEAQVFATSNFSPVEYFRKLHNLYKMLKR